MNSNINSSSVENKITAAGETSSNAIDIETTIGADIANADNIKLFDDWFAEEEAVNELTLEMLRIGPEPKFLQVFTKQCTKVEVHYLEPDDGFPKGGYHHCLGDDCPACKAMMTKTKFMLMPVGDLIHGDIKILRIPIEKGPGKLATELGKLFALNDPSAVTTIITRARNYKYTVITKPAGEYHSDIAEAAKRFLQNIDDGLIRINDAISSISADDMATHSEIAKMLKLVGNA